jgi:hypothetical protein
MPGAGREDDGTQKIVCAVYAETRTSGGRHRVQVMLVGDHLRDGARWHWVNT